MCPMKCPHLCPRRRALAGKWPHRIAFTSCLNDSWHCAHLLAPCHQRRLSRPAAGQSTSTASRGHPHPPHVGIRGRGVVVGNRQVEIFLLTRLQAPDRIGNLRYKPEAVIHSLVLHGRQCSDCCHWRCRRHDISTAGVRHGPATQTGEISCRWQIGSGPQEIAEAGWIVRLA